MYQYLKMIHIFINQLNNGFLNRKNEVCQILIMKTIIYKEIKKPIIAAFYFKKYKIKNNDYRI